ncbi:GTPase HflX [Ignavibacteria bacterium CHB1]|jgi:GTP-binding protein HflX|nr:MAG: GTPase HflX [Chlorobiota bacterium]MBV6399061.1 GTPase HflX [Ignavibacteria bacterium]MCC6885279.1 GTPase HflX [Ignavibacteriales bacterium]MDL1887264.1 GTPase HflX [Ignavibacteria bacterium CHB1]
MAMIETKKEPERVAIVCYSNTSDEKNIHREIELDELEFLAKTAGANILKRFYQQNRAFDSKYLIGRGKVDEIAEYVASHNIQSVIFENILSPSQQRNLEREIKCKIIDKATLILDIFANNARTSQAKLQVELAQLEYLLPRLTRAWLHLSKQYGGIGTKGPGETQIETDRRLIGKRITLLKSKLRKIESQRKTQSEERSNYYRISLVGYTNAGKSTLLNLLTDSDVYVRDELFATLDTSTRALNLNKVEKKSAELRFPKKVLISDTVGFIRNLPHGLIESFKSTLSEVVESDLLLHVIDISNPEFSNQIKTVNETLKEIGADGKPVINVFNKVDRLEDKEYVQDVNRDHPDAVFISAQKGIGVYDLLNKIKKVFSNGAVESEIRLNAGDYKTLAELHRIGDVRKVRYLKNGIKVKVIADRSNLNKIIGRV